jgi:hypothetical protein
MIAGQAMRFAVNPQYNLVRRDGLSDWTVAFQVSLLVPAK